ncbi:hypothetical protein BV902_13120 [Sphingobacterium sp. B29]|uniref:DNA adenine methylase n=1 Tax=Sphingobacterium sp. B29 TaxID=1933220 RepID=UPI00095843F0|nr:Dam family site-specific DNA-(adenine-N6)-methyltransferase [Sphingobacterium sp. B29]APU97172.1 hypothetical protein BV902_13120 [Sphingobacterium sp. B29]
MPKPFLRWAGSKKKLLPELEKYFSNDIKTYIEPFVGSGQLFFKLPINSAVLGDTNAHLIKTYEHIRENPEEIHEILSGFPCGKDEYYEIRKEYNKGKTGIYNSALFLYLNTFCFNGLYRTNNSGQFNVPYSPSSGHIIDLETLLKISQFLKKAVFIKGDFENVVLENCNAGDFVYLDPPYAIKNRRIFNQYGPDSFGTNDIKRLKELLSEINYRSAKFVLSYALCDESLDLSDDWNSEVVNTTRNISGFAQHRKVEKEVIITNIEK